MKNSDLGRLGGYLGDSQGASLHPSSIFDAFWETFWRHSEPIGDPLASQRAPRWAFFSALIIILQHQGGIGGTTRCAPSFNPLQGKKK